MSRDLCRSRRLSRDISVFDRSMRAARSELQRAFALGRPSPGTSRRNVRRQFLLLKPRNTRKRNKALYPCVAPRVSESNLPDMQKRVLITGGAGFIGSHVLDLMLASGYDIRILDNLTQQVHGPDAKRPDYLASGADLIVGDVRDRETVENALQGVDGVIHLAASVGVGQSMYDIVSYVEVNEAGTAVLLEALSKKPVERLVVASSMSIYGEGLARRPGDGFVNPEPRTTEQMKRGAMGAAERQ